MQKTIDIDNINNYNIACNHKTLHPLVTVIDFSKTQARDWGEVESMRFQYGLYTIFLKDVKCGDLVYGRKTYDYQAGTLVFFAPGQSVVLPKPKEIVAPKGYGLLFHPDLLHGTGLTKILQECSFFSYQSSEALHISDDERQMVLDCFAKIELELSRPIDNHSKRLIASNIELFLGYCQRYYDRQFITREKAHSNILEKFESALNTYFQSNKPQQIGLPSVAYFAELLHISANYFGDLIKKETGQNAKEFIQNKIIEIAKEKVFAHDKTMNEIAYELGFKYPQHFTRLFRQRVGVNPGVWRLSKMA
jgi:AraC-like DNA-binding protein